MSAIETLPLPAVPPPGRSTADVDVTGVASVASMLTVRRRGEEAIIALSARCTTGARTCG